MVDKKGRDNAIADHLSYLESEEKEDATRDIQEHFLDEHLLSINFVDPWYENYKACKIIHHEISY